MMHSSTVFMHGSQVASVSKWTGRRSSIPSHISHLGGGLTSPPGGSLIPGGGGGGGPVSETSTSFTSQGKNWVNEMSNLLIGKRN